MNPSWHLRLDEVQSYAYWEGLFTKEECVKIIEIAKKQGLTKGTTGGNVVGLRSSKICWLVPNDDLNWAFRKLTDPKDYEGGELILYNTEKGEEMKKEQGTLILFPSYTLHEVKPIIKGERNSLVSWVTGEQFK